MDRTGSRDSRVHLEAKNHRGCFSKDVVTAVLIGIAKHACHQYVETDATHKNALPRITDTRSDPWSMEIRCFQGVFLRCTKLANGLFF